MAKKHPLTVDELWSIPRVGTPAPAPDGSFVIVPVTTYDMETNAGTTRLWRVADDGDPIALTDDDRSALAPCVSPDGAEILFLRKPGSGDHGDENQVHRMTLGGGEAVCLTDLPYGAVDPRWFPDGRRIAFLSSVCLESPGLDETAAYKKSTADESPRPIVTEDRAFRMWDHWLPDDVRLHLFSLDPETDEIRDLTPRFTGYFDRMDPSGQYDIAPDGRRIVFSGTRKKRPGARMRDGLHLLDLDARGRAGRVRDITSRETGNGFTPRFSPDGRTILYGTRPNDQRWDDRTRLAEYDVRRDSHTVLTEKWTLTPTEWTYRSDGRAILAFAGVDGRSGLFNVSRSGRRVTELVRGGTYAGLRPAGKRVFTTESTLRRPGEVVSLGIRDGATTVHSKFTHDVLRHVTLGRVEDITFKGAGDDPVQMYLVHPPGKKASARSRVPLVHFIHGGPHANFGDTWHWRWCAQLCAAQGYLVALVNFHGSDGWGQDFRSSIVGRWGDQSYEDVMRATDWLIERRHVDSRRMAATGGSYGGYMASWIASQTDRFACIVNHAGVCDLQMQLSCDVPDGWPGCAGGSPWNDREGMDRYSPMRHADGFSSPMLVIHGELDYRVPYYQGLEIYNAYKARNLDARLVFYRDENHWILKPRNSRHWYGEVFDWLKRWL